nr:MAG TPA: hypothetical protein [Crassvirales sp.]
MIYLCQTKLSTYNIPIRITTISSTRVHCVILWIIILLLLCYLLFVCSSKCYVFYSIRRAYCLLSLFVRNIMSILMFCANIFG